MPLLTPAAPPTRTPTQLSIVDGDAPVGSGHDTELLHSDEGQPLLAAHLTSTRRDDAGRLLLPLASGRSRLPELYTTDKNDTVGGRA
jgi:hypothetical protein